MKRRNWFSVHRVIPGTRNTAARNLNRGRKNALLLKIAFDVSLHSSGTRTSCYSIVVSSCQIVIDSRGRNFSFLTTVSRYIHGFI